LGVQVGLGRRPSTYRDKDEGFVFVIEELGIEVDGDAITEMVVRAESGCGVSGNHGPPKKMIHRGLILIFRWVDFDFDSPVG
jgi:hypothetical protein